MEAFVRALAVELAPIRVNSVMPGVIKTKLWNSLPETDREALYNNVGKTVPVKRIGEAGFLHFTLARKMGGRHVTKNRGGKFGTPSSIIEPRP